MCATPPLVLAACCLTSLLQYEFSLLYGIWKCTLGRQKITCVKFSCRSCIPHLTSRPTKISVLLLTGCKIPDPRACGIFSGSPWFFQSLRKSKINTCKIATDELISFHALRMLCDSCSQLPFSLSIEVPRRRWKRWCKLCSFVHKQTQHMCSTCAGPAVHLDNSLQGPSWASGPEVRDLGDGREKFDVFWKQLTKKPIPSGLQS